MRAARRQARERWTGRRVRGWLLGLLALGSVALGEAQARTVRILSAQTLELRKTSGQELVIISGPEGGAAELRVDDDEVRAERVEFNRTRRTLTLIGGATYRSAKDGQVLRGENLVVNLGDESLTGQDVLISDSQLEIRGAEVERVPGQLRARSSYFTPCARCGRTTNDYAFRAERVIVYPGDRLVAYRVQFLIADFPVLYLPFVVLPLGDEDRQPRVEVGQDDLDGYTVEADLPFAVGNSILGTTLLRYYQNRSPGLSGGVDLRAYAPLPWVDRADFYTLLLAKPLAQGGEARPGQDLDLNFSVRGRVPLTEAVRPLTYEFSLVRRDIGQSDTSPERGVARANFSASVEYPRFSAQLNYVDRYGPEPTTAVVTPYERAEVVLDPKPVAVGDLNADVRFTVGRYTAAVNPFSRAARLAGGLNLTTTRLEETHTLRYARPLWTGAELLFTNSFTGRYYGTGARTVQLSVAGQITQRWAATNSVILRQEYFRNEGVSPFAFDTGGSRRLSAPLSLSVSAVPAKDVVFTASYSRDPFLTPEQQRPATFGVSVNRRPVSLTSSLDYNFATKELEALRYTVTLGDPDAGKLTLVPARPAVPATPTAPARPAAPAYYQRSSAWPFPKFSLSASGGYTRPSTPSATDAGLNDFTLRATVAGDDRSSNFSVAATYDFDRERPLKALSTEYTLVRGYDTVLNPVTVTGRQTLRLDTPRIEGGTTVNWRGLAFSEAHNLALEQAPTVRESGTVTFSVGNQAGRANNWQLSYGGGYDLVRGGFTRPSLTGRLNLTRPGQRLSAEGVYRTRGLDQPYAELGSARLDGEWQQGRFTVAGRASYARTRSTLTPDVGVTDRLVFDPLRVGVGLGRREKPDLYLTATLRQTLTYVDGVRQNPEPLSPVFGFTLDRCCWALQGEWDVVGKRYRLAIGMPGQFYPLIEGDPLTGPRVPLLPFSRPVP